LEGDDAMAVDAHRRIEHGHLIPSNQQLPERLPALARYAIKLTRTPHDIVDLNHVVAYFNYVNRVADGLGGELEARCAGTGSQPGKGKNRRFQIAHSS
jgi:hypothetical protein